MASALQSTLGGGGGITPAGLPDPASSSHSHGHGILKNLIDDAVNTAKGLPFGIVQTAEHPVRSIHQMGQSYGEMYGHGWHHFWSDFHQHPLQPLLDAISVPLLLAGGAGAAVKGASFAAELGGHGAEYAAAMDRASALAEAGKFAEADAARAEAMNAPRLYKLSQHFREGTQHTTRMYDTGAGYDLPKNYSTNLFRRFMTKGTDAVLEGIVGRKVDFFSEAGKGRRLLQQETSRREAGAAGRAYGQAGFLTSAKKHGVHPVEAGQALQRDFTRNALETGRKVAADKAVQLPDNSEYTYLMRDPMAHGTVVAPEHLGKVHVHFTDGTSDWMYPHDAQDLLRATTREKNADRIQYYHSTPADAHYRDENAVVSHIDPKEPFVGHPGNELATKAKDLQGYGGDQVKEFIQTLGGHFKYTRDPAKAWRDEHGNLTIMRGGDVAARVKEVDGAMELAKKVYFAPLTVWKAMILAQSPRYLVNNVIGNATMYGAATNPVEMTRGMLAAAKATYGIRKAARMERQMGETIDSLMAKFLPNEFVHSQFGYLQHGALSLGKTLEKGRTPFGRRHFLTPLYGVTEKIAYRAPQRASIMGAITRMPEFRNLMRLNKRAGLDDYAAFQKSASTMLRDPRIRGAVEKRVTDWAGQYYHLNSLEQGLTALVPFYNWTRHALRFGKEQTLARPVQTGVMAALGALGDAQAKKELGNVPDFLKGAIPVKGASGGVLGFLFGQAMPGRKKVVLTAGYNPLAAAAEDAKAIAALAGGGGAREAIGGQLNPVVSGAIAGVTGQQLFSGAKSPYGSPLSGALGETFLQEPHAKLLHDLVSGPPSTKTKRGEPTLYTKSIRQQLSSILGLNERDFSPKTATRLYNQQEGIKETAAQKHANRSRGARKAARHRARSHVSALKSQL